MISAAEKFKQTPKKTKFWKEKSVEDVITLGPMARAILVLTKGTTQNGESKEGGHILINFLFKIPLNQNTNNRDHNKNSTINNKR